jgi:thiol-disulfide isomerase/thioredoxin
MVSLTTPVCEFGWKAPDFALPGVDGKIWTLKDAMGPNGMLVMFICNHCPYVKAIRPRLVRDHAEDSFDNMKKVAAEFGFSFPYVIDETQAVAKAYGAVCTPDFFGFNRDFELQYRGRFDESRKETAPEGVRRDLFEAMKAIAQTQRGPAEQIPSMGCSIKWKGE